MHLIKPVALSLVSASEPEDDAPLWDIATNYGIGASVIRDHAVFVSTIDGNVGLDPALEVQELEGARWLRAGATNIYRFFEGGLSTKTVGASPLVLEVSVDDSFNTMALFDLVCSECLIEVLTGGVVGATKTIRSGAEPVGDWWSWLNSVFFKDSRRFIAPNMAGGATSTVRLTITGEAPSLGELVVGRAVEIGTTRLTSGTSVKRRTFTTIKTNEFGVASAQKRAIARDVVYSIHAKRVGFEARERLLDSIDGVRVATYAKAEGWPQLINFGFVTDFEIPVDLPDDFIFEITIQGVS